MTTPAEDGLPRVVRRPCLTCTQEFDSLLPQQVICPTCVGRAASAELEALRTQLTDQIDQHTDLKLTTCGYGAVELGARLDAIPDGLKRKLPARLVRPIVEGALEVGGFGLSGGQGVGKTMCFAALLRARTKVILERAIAALTAVPDTNDLPWHIAASFCWVNWPDRAAWLKTMVMQQGGAQAIEQFTRSASNARLLVLDDLGRERLGRAYDEDFAFGVLDRIVDTRSRALSPILWTSNLTRGGVATRYGAALTSRLLGLAPAVELPKLPDSRLA